MLLCEIPTHSLRRFSTGSDSSAGPGHANEDRVVVTQDLPIWAVVDGHGGRLAAEYLMTHLIQALLAQNVLQSGTEAAKSAIYTLDEEFLRQAEKIQDDSGACLACSFVIENKLVTVWCGDCRAYFFDSQTGLTQPLTRDHNPTTNAQEKERLLLARVPIRGGRVAGILEPSRSLGDLKLKQRYPQGVISNCDATEIELQPHEGVDVLILATDGLWESMTSSTAVEIVLDLVQQAGCASNEVATVAARELVRLGRLQCDDDCSAVVVLFDRGEIVSSHQL